MASIVPGFEYDIFISYRQKDNKGERWVSDFVDSLKSELDSTFKEEISLYFDINPHNGLLETHDVDASLKLKLNCLVFIPVISRTYCDPRSFAWQNEFTAFAENASVDGIGLKLTLPGGIAVSRILPVRIHDLDAADIRLCESVLGETLRGVEFIYREPGVNRPMTRLDDDEKNLNGTTYRNQINRVANIIYQIISAIRQGSSEKSLEVPTAIRTSKDKTAKSIAVLPFVDMSPARDQEYFCDGISEEIINTLSHNSSFKVIARTSAFAFKNKETDIREIGRKLNVETLLEGSIRKSDNRLRIIAQLVRVDDGTHIWSERYDRELKDIFEVQDEISHAIMQNLQLKLLGSPEKPSSRRHTRNIEAYNLYLKGTHCWQMLTPGGYSRASEYFREALKLDPGFAIVYAGLAAIDFVSTTYGSVPPDEAFPRAIGYVNKALEIDENLAEAYSVLGNINTFYRWDRAEAERNFRHAISINPNSPLNHIYYSFLLTCSGRSEEAISEAKTARELDPLSAYINTEVALAYSFSGDYKKAIEEYRMTLSLNPHYYFTHLMLGNTYYSNSMIPEAVEEFGKATALSSGNPFVTACLDCGYFLTGRTEEAEKLFSELKERARTEYIPSSAFYLIHKFRGEKEAALQWLSRACDEHDSFLPWLLAGRVYIPEGSEYRELLRSRGL